MAVFFGLPISLEAMNTPLKFSSFLLLVCFTFGAGAVTAQTPRSSCDKVDWSTLPSRFTHDSTGQRVQQFAEKVEPVAQQRSDFQRSGYRNFRSSLQVGSSADNMHVVEQWGADIQPYEAWRFPYRPYGAPYQQWGPNTQFWGANPYWPGAVWPGGGVPPWPVPAGNNNGMPPNAVPPPNHGYGPNPYNNQTAPWNPGSGPWTDGYYQDAPQKPRMPDRQFFYTPGL
jgi:hypothetical protein